MLHQRRLDRSSSCSAYEEACIDRTPPVGPSASWGKARPPQAWSVIVVAPGAFHNRCGELKMGAR